MIFGSLVIALRGMFPPDWIIERLLKEWPVISQAPFTFIVACLLMSGVVILITVPFIYLLFRVRLQSKAAQLILKDSEITLLKTKVDDLKERLGYVLPDKTAYSQLTNKELKDAALKFAMRLYDFAERTEQSRPDEMRLLEGKTLALSRAQDNAERERIYKQYRDKHTRHDDAWRSARDSEYDKDFQPTATLLRDEMRKRLPPNALVNQWGYESYDRLIGAQPLKNIVADLRKLAGLLPRA